MARIKALIDGDIILYGCGFASQHTWYYVYCEDDYGKEDEWIAKYKYKKDAVEWVNGQDDLVIVQSIESQPQHIAFSNVRNFIKKIQRVTRAYENYVIYFTPSKLERDDIATLQVYKGNRIGAPKPLHYQAIKDYIFANYKTKEYRLPDGRGLEADDGMAMDQDGDKTIICTADKDLNMVPGWRYRDGEVYWITPEEGQLSFYTQLLTGDATDNIPGLFKLTGVKALAKLKKPLEELTEPWEMYEHVRGVYMEAFGCDRELNDIDVVLLEIGRLLWMRREMDKNWEIPREPLDDADQKGMWGMEEQ